MNRVIDDITNFIFVEDDVKNSDILFLPGCSNPSLPERAAELYALGIVSILLPSGGVSIKLKEFPGASDKKDIYNKKYCTEYEFFEDVLIRNGVPRSAIIKEDKARYTKENAYNSKKIIEESNLCINNAIICCKSYHARRCLMFYKLAFPTVDFAIQAVDVYGINRYNWFKTAIGIEIVLGELERCGNQFIDKFKSEYLKC